MTSSSEPIINRNHRISDKIFTDEAFSCGLQEDMVYIRCTFTDSFFGSTEILDSQFLECTFKKVNFRKAEFNRCQINMCRFEECEFLKSIFDNTIVKDSEFNTSDFNSTCFYDGEFVNTNFRKDNKHLNQLVISNCTFFNANKRIHMNSLDDFTDKEIENILMIRE